ncbi:MAG: Jag N-terminal domain-containing protein [Endomicrobiia bacterium]
MTENLDKIKSLYKEVFQIEVTGSNVEDAIEKGLKLTGLNKDEIVVQVLFEGTPGLFGLVGEKPAKIIFSPLYDKKELWLKCFLVRLINTIFPDNENFYVDIETKGNECCIIVVVKDEIYNKLSKNTNIELYNSIFSILEILLHRLNIAKKLFLEIKKF